MATIRSVQNTANVPSGAQSIVGRPPDNVYVDWGVAVISVLIMLGLFLDGWAHNHGRVDDTFFTPWHAVLYGAYGLAGLLLIVTHFRNVGKGYSWTKALPKGYMTSLAGVFIFAVAGAADMFWHEAFGFEESIEALISPSHLSLALGGLLITTGPVRALWQRQTDDSWRSLMPAILAFTAAVSVFTFFMSFAAVTGKLTGMVGPRPGPHQLYDVHGIMAFLVQVNLLMGVVLLMMRSWQLPFGTMTLMFAFNAALMVWMHVGETPEFAWVISAAIAGLLGDLLRDRLTMSRHHHLRWFAFLVPFVYSLGAIFVLQYLGASVWNPGGDMWWKIHMWLGAPILAGVFGYGLSLLILPPPYPPKQKLTGRTT